MLHHIQGDMIVPESIFQIMIETWQVCGLHLWKSWYICVCKTLINEYSRGHNTLPAGDKEIMTPGVSLQTVSRHFCHFYKYSCHIVAWGTVPKWGMRPLCYPSTFIRWKHLPFLVYSLTLKIIKALQEFFLCFSLCCRCHTLSFCTINNRAKTFSADCLFYKL